MADDDASERGERRRVGRMVVDLQVDFNADDMLLYSYITDLSPLGIFLRSNAPFEVGTHLTMRFTPPGEEEVEIEGEVRWVSPFRLGALEAREPGMGVQFIDPPERLRERLMDLVGGALELRRKDGDRLT